MRKEEPALADNNKRSIGPVGILLCGLLILATVFVGYKLAGRLRNFVLNRNGIETEDKQADGDKTGVTGLPGGQQDKNRQAALNMTPVNLVMVVNSETGRIEEYFIEILRAAEGKLDYIRLASEISYTMSSSLYAELIVDNTELPQTVTLSEIYRYYHNDKAYDAARRVVGELVNFNILYCTAVSDESFAEFVSVRDTASGMQADFVHDRDEIVSSAYGTPGSVKGAMDTALNGAVTNWSMADRLRYLDVYDGLMGESVTFLEAPVIQKNESCELDTAGTGAILYGILY